MDHDRKLKAQLKAMQERLESDLKLCDELGQIAIAIDINQAIEKLKLQIEEMS